MKQQLACEVCDKKQKTYFCSTCSCSFCDDCWDSQIQHRPGRVTLDGRTHVKEDKAMVERMHSILEPPQDSKTLQAMHVKDQDTRWFGVLKSDRGDFSQFHDFNRYAQLMLDSRPLTGAPRYPKLISFIGDTNAGKSTIVKALISRGVLDLQEGQAAEAQMPIPGSVEHESTSTSEGVHLYADPSHLESERPILYADCEGLNAGERPPFAAEVLSRGDLASPRQRLQKRLQPLARDIKWFKNGDPVRGTREFTVGQLYPRFLYTFSDAIVFVQKNPKQIHKTYKYLVDWAKFNVEEALNQPILPHAIVVLNAVDTGDSATRWTVEDATQSFFQGVEKAVAHDPDLQKLAALRGIDPAHTSASQQLLKCFYSETHVIRVPHKMPERYALINDQVGLLHDLIIAAGDKAHYAKLVRRRLNDVDALSKYLQAGFDHFAANIDQPFDFRNVSLRNRMITQDFGDHIINLASTVQDHTRVKGAVLFRGLVSLVASCILLDYVRNDRPDSIMEYFPSDYAPMCKAALVRFCDEYVPCQFVGKKNEDCKNVKSAHVKGHQNSKGKITPGEYQSSFNAESFEAEWIQSLELKLEQLEKEFDMRRTRDQSFMSDIAAAVKLHSDALGDFFAQLETVQLCVSNATCFGCLMAVPEIPLGCGHAFCKQCVSENSVSSSDTAFHVSACPLHPQETFHWEVSRKPEFAGVRILTLDGGGMRGIVELEMLRAIERRINVGSTLGVAIPIQRFFDLIVGTSTGGVIALGLTVKNWRVGECIDRFMRLCDTAFSPREFNETAFQMLATLGHGSKWKTTPFRDALLTEFGAQPLFGGSASSDIKYATKVAVTTTSEAGCRSLILANYNRPDMGNFNHSLELPDDPKHSFAIWEAAAATSAAPSYFKAFESRGKKYMDGALNHNNPVYIAWRESKMIWPDAMSKQPDILISLGTGQHKADIDAKLKQDNNGKPRVNSHEESMMEPKTAPKISKRYKAWHGVKSYLSVLVSKIDNILDTERVWNDFFANIVEERWSTEDSARYVRVNPDLGSQPPKLDEKDRLESLQYQVHKMPREDPTLGRTIGDVANRLIASSFYFRSLRIESSSNESIISGSIHSKFDGKPVYMEQIARFLKSQLVGDFVPKLVISRYLSTSSEKFEYDLDQEFIENLLASKEFNYKRQFDIAVRHQDEPTYICLQLRRDDNRNRVMTTNYPISGFPRKFIVEKEHSNKRLQKQRPEAKRPSKPASDPIASENKSPPSEKISRFVFLRFKAPTSSTMSSTTSREELPAYQSPSEKEYDSDELADRYENQLRNSEKDDE